MNIYSSEIFLKHAAAAFFPGQSWCTEIVEVRGQLFRVLVVEKKQTVGSVPFLDFLEPLPPDSGPAQRKEAWLPRVSHHLVSVADWQKGGHPHGTEASPTLIWEEWPNFPAFVQNARDNNSQAFSERHKKKWDKIPTELGPFRYIYDIRGADAPQLLERLMGWKSAQYKRTGLGDNFARPKTRKFFELLLASGVLHLSGVFAGDQPLALHAGFVHDQRFYFVLPAYDAQYQRYKPGQLLLESMLDSSFKAGHREFDFLLGDEPYKFYYANRVRLVGPIGYRLMQDKVYAPLRRAAMHIVRSQPGIYKSLQSIKRNLKERGIL